MRRRRGGHGAQFAIVTVQSLEGDTVEEAAVNLFQKWGIGKKDGKNRDEGILVLLAVDDRKNRIEVGFGLEPIITDGDSGDVLRSIRPILRQRNYGGALLSAAAQLGQRIAEAKGVTIEGQPQRRQRGNGGGFPVGLIVAGFIVLMVIVSALGGRRGGGPPMGGRGGGGGDLLLGMLLGNLIGGAGGGRRGSDWSHGGFGGSGGGGGWGGGGGGGGFGGFGGGGSGGGGASGGW
ncbi:MAG: TPM domain-containing protein [Acidobacteriota bacterium]